MVDGSLFIQIWPARAGVVVVRAEGRIDAETSATFLDKCRSCFEGGDLVLNLGRVTFLSSSGVGALLVLLEMVRERGGELRVAPASPEVSSVIEMLNLGHALMVHDSEVEALERLRAA